MRVASRTDEADPERSSSWYAVPLTVATILGMFRFFLTSIAFLVIPAFLVLVASLVPWQLQIYGFPVKPAVYYLVEDSVALDFGYGRPWRTALQAR